MVATNFISSFLSSCCFLFDEVVRLEASQFGDDFEVCRVIQVTGERRTRRLRTQGRLPDLAYLLILCFVENLDVVALSDVGHGCTLD